MILRYHGGTRASKLGVMHLGGGRTMPAGICWLRPDNVPERWTPRAKQKLCEQIDATVMVRPVGSFLAGLLAEGRGRLSLVPRLKGHSAALTQGLAVELRASSFTTSANSETMGICGYSTRFHFESRGRRASACVLVKEAKTCRSPLTD
jgi:hypothetical protein